MRFYFLLFICVVFAGTLSFHQTDYHLIIERLNLTFHNKSYIKNPKLEIYFVTRYSKKCNFSMDSVQEVDSKFMTFHLEARKFQSNEYRLFPFNYSENVCASIRNPKFGNQLNQFETNFVQNCVLKTGHYYFRNLHYDDSKFPPYAPRGRYLFISKMILREKILISTWEVYIEIKAQNPLERVVGV